MKPRSPFFTGSWRGTTPLLIWAGHFLVCYVSVALACDQGWGRQTWMETTVLQWGLLAFSVATLSGLGWLAATACRGAMRNPGATLAMVRLLAALLALVATLWTTAPLMWLRTCHFT